MLPPFGACLGSAPLCTGLQVSWTRVWISRNDGSGVGGRAEDEAGEGAGRTLQGPPRAAHDAWTLLNSGIRGPCVRGWPLLV